MLSPVEKPTFPMIKAITFVISLEFAAFVFLALLEFTVVNYLWRKECNKNFYRVNKALFRNSSISEHHGGKANHSTSASVENVGKSPSTPSLVSQKRLNAFLSQSLFPIGYK
jgi:hypothetical protein